MKIEVTKDEATRIIAERWAKNNKRGSWWLFTVLLSLPPFIALDNMDASPVYQVLVVVAFLIPGVVMYLRWLKRSGKYAQEEIKRLELGLNADKS